MNIKNKGTGAGGAKTNLNGIKFEDDVYLKEWLENESFTLKPVSLKTHRSEFYEIYSSEKLLGYYGRQSTVYKALKMMDSSIDEKYIDAIFSKRIHPDGFILTISPKQLIIFEKKWQQSSGSVDEKIQTAPFKLSMFEKLLAPKGINCFYQYILSDWFRRPEYKNVKEYYSKMHNISVWVDNENLKDLKLKDFIKE